MVRVIPLLLGVVLLVSGCATATRFATGPAAFVSCPARLMNQAEKNGDQMMESALMFGAPIFGIAGWGRGVKEGFEADMRKLHGQDYESKDFTATLNCDME